MSATPNMNLTAPTIGTTAGPTWAQNINDDLTTIDAHDHSPGNGVRITPDGMSITGDLPFNSHNITLVRSLRLSAISLGTVTASDVGCLVESGVDLYYIDGNANQIRITQSGSIAGASGTITGLTSPASAAYSAGSTTFTFQSASNTAAILDVGSIIVRKTTASSSGITIAAPSGLAANYTMTLLSAAPASTSFLSIDSSGNLGSTVAVNAGITSTNIAAGGVSRANLVAVGQQVSSSSTSYATNSAVFVSVTNLSVSITTTGRPVILVLQPDGGATQAELSASGGSSTGIYQWTRAGSSIAVGLIRSASPATTTPTMFVDVVAAGTYTYALQVKGLGGSTVSVANFVVVAYEL